MKKKFRYGNSGSFLTCAVSGRPNHNRPSDQSEQRRLLETRGSEQGWASLAFKIHLPAVHNNLTNKSRSSGLLECCRKVSFIRVGAKIFTVTFGQFTASMQEKRKTLPPKLLIKVNNDV